MVNILLVDDDPVQAKLLARRLKKFDYSPQIATNGVEAWRHIQQTGSRLVICDWMMPEMSGIELCRRIRTHQGMTYIYIILLTGRGDMESRVEGLEAGADDFLAKPPDEHELFARLQVARRIIAVQDELKGYVIEAVRLRRELEALKAGAPAYLTQEDSARPFRKAA